VDLLPVIDRLTHELVGASPTAWNSLLDLVLAPKKLELNTAIQGFVGFWLHQQSHITEDTVVSFYLLCVKWPNVEFQFDTDFGFLSFAHAASKCQWVSYPSFQFALDGLSSKPKLLLQQLKAATMYSDDPVLVFACLEKLAEFVAIDWRGSRVSDDDVGRLVCRVVNKFRHQENLPWDLLRLFVRASTMRCNADNLQTLADVSRTCVLDPHHRPAEFGHFLVERICKRAPLVWPESRFAAYLGDLLYAQRGSDMQAEVVAAVVAAVDSPRTRFAPDSEDEPSDEHAPKRRRSAQLP